MEETEEEGEVKVLVEKSVSGRERERREGGRERERRREGE